MGMDLSEKRMSEWRSFDSTDTMNNLYANSGLKPKYLMPTSIRISKGPKTICIPATRRRYLKLDRVPGPDEDWTPVLKALRDGNFFVTTGEILIPHFAVEGTGNKRTITADVNWTFPLEFVEVVWGDGKKMIARSFPRPICRRWAASTSRFRSTPPAKRGCGLRCGTRPAIRVSSTPCG